MNLRKSPKVIFLALQFSGLVISVQAQGGSSVGETIVGILGSILAGIIFLIVALLCVVLSFFVFLPFYRTIWAISGRYFGFYNPRHFSRFTKFWLPWRLLYEPLHTFRQWIEKNFRFGGKSTAGWASVRETMSLLYKPGDIFLGRLSVFGIPFFQPVGIKGDTGRHISIVAGTGSGKTTYLITMLGLHDGNMFVVDCDAQMYNTLRRRQGRGGNGVLGKGKKVFVLDPYNQAIGSQSASWNPIEEIDAAVEQHGEDMAVDVAISLSHSLIRIMDTKNEWVYTAARQFMIGLILYVWRYSPPEHRNLLRVRELLTQGLKDEDLAEFDSFDVLLEAMKMKDDFGGIIAEAAASMRGSSSDKNYPRESAIDQTSWISIPQVAKTLKHSDFLCRDLKISDTSVFIAAPVTDIQGKLSGWVRCLTMMTMEAFQKTQGQPKNVCLFALDEMPSLGRIPVLVDASAVFRKYKVRLITVTQDIEKLKAAYPNEWGGFLGNSECVIWMATNNHETKEYLSQLLGKATIKEHEEAKWVLSKKILSRKKIKVMRHDRALMTAEQIGRFLSSNIIVTRYGNRPLKLKHAPYYTDLPVFYYEADPKFGENERRAYTRKLLNEKLLKSARFRKFIK